jgi:hypothetical protein
MRCCYLEGRVSAKLDTAVTTQVYIPLMSPSSSFVNTTNFDFTTHMCECTQRQNIKH